MGAGGTFELIVRDERRMHMLSELAPVAMFETTIGGEVSWANERWFQITNLESAATLGQSWFETVHPHDRVRVMETWRSSISAKARIALECRLILPARLERWIEVQGMPHEDPVHGHTTYLLAAADVTEKRQFQEMTRTIRDLESWAEQSAAALARQDKELGIFAALVASSADAIVIVEPDGHLRYVNDAFRDYFDLTANASWSDLLSALGLDEATRNLLHAASLAGEHWQSVVTLERPQRDTMHAEISSFSILDATSRKIGLAVVIRDLSAHMEAERERSRLSAEIIAAQDAAIRELSTPLLPIGPGILAMPLIGNIDAARGRRILDILLEGISDHHATVAIVDVTGVREMNAEVADILLRSARAAQLLGTNLLLTGVSSRVAKTLIELGADLSRVRTLATLEQGIRAAFVDSRAHRGHQRPNTHPLSPSSRYSR